MFLDECNTSAYFFTQLFSYTVIIQYNRAAKRVCNLNLDQNYHN